MLTMTAVSSYLAFASNLQRRLVVEKNEPKAAAALLAEVNDQVKTLGRYAEKTSHGMHGDENMEREGTSLWNLCTRLNREPASEKSSKVPETSRLVLASRIVAYQILHLCQWSPKSSARVACHLMRIALKAAKVFTGSCLFQFRSHIHKRALVAKFIVLQHR